MKNRALMKLPTEVFDDETGSLCGCSHRTQPTRESKENPLPCRTTTMSKGKLSPSMRVAKLIGPADEVADRRGIEIAGE